MLPNGLDIAVLVIIGVFVFLGWKNGLVKMGIRLISFLVALVCAWAFHPILSGFLQETALYENLVSSVASRAGEIVKTPGALQSVSALSGVQAVEYVARLLLNGIAFLLILILAKIILYFVVRVLNIVASLPILGFVNRISGMAIGVVEGLLVVWLLLAALVVVPPLRENKSLGYTVEQSVVARSLYHHNILLDAFLPEAETFGEK